MAFVLLSAFFLLLVSLIATWGAAAESQALVQRSDSQYAPANNPRFALPTTQEPIPDVSKDYKLLDIALVASVDGKFHALNRTSGQTLWSMSSFATTTSVSAPSSLAPLVRTAHAQHDPDLDDDEDTETYIIEPQSGDIYVLQSPSAPLQRFPFSMSQLVDISPFTSVGERDTKVFVGRKETSLLLIELETGRIKATLNAECPFVPEEYQDIPADIDDFEGRKPPISAPTEVYIGRTDYHISILKKPEPGKPAPPPQELSFSTYGPNNKENHLQSIYRRTADNTYIQALPDGNVMSFRTKNGSTTDEKAGPSWSIRFPNTIVAIFDVLQSSTSSSHTSPHPFVLLQPQPTFNDLFPLDTYPGASRPPHSTSAYVGLVEETDSLFALSPAHFPLAVFGGSERHGLASGVRHGQTIDGPKSEADKVQDGSDDTTESDLQFCLANKYTPHCLVGVHKLSLDSDAEAHIGRWKRLLDPPKTQGPAVQQPMDNGDVPDRRPQGVLVGRPWNTDEGDNASGSAGGDTEDGSKNRPVPVYEPPRPWLGLPAIGDGRGSKASALQGSWEAISLWVVLALVGTWMVLGRLRVWLGPRRNVAEREQKRRVGNVSRTASGDEGEGNKETAPSAIVEEKEKDLGRVHFAEKKDTEPQHIDGQTVDVNGVPPPLVVDVPGQSAVDVLELARPSTPKAKPAALDVDGANRVVNGQDLNGSALATPKAVSSVAVASGSGSAGVVDTEDGDDSEGEAEGGVAATPGKKKSRRGKRGKKKKASVLAATVSGDGADKEKEKDQDKGKEQDKEEEKKPSSIVLTTSSPKPIIQQPSLVVSDTILGFGSHGTVVFQGSLQGRAVAVKRLLQDFVTLAAREVSILQESDDHPNVIRYYYQESHANFLYIALELCPASLADIIEAPDRAAYRDIAINFDPKRALKQIASGLRHLHALKLVHRDIKPQNILVGISPGASVTGIGKGGKGYRMLISDFGLCKKLDMDQTSFLPTAHGALGAGTVGWRAPEILRGEVKLDEMANGDESMSSRGSVATISGSSSSGGGLVSGKPTRLTKSVDIFALGCLFYYTLTSGGHPYGDRFEREVNIMRDAKDLSSLERFGEEGTEATDLICEMLSPEARDRPDTTTILLHPFFWDAGRRLNFLQDASDRFEIMCRDPKEPNLLALEEGAFAVVGNDWQSRLDKIFIENLGKFRKYDGKSVQDLMRALRNKKHHYQDLPDNVKRHLGPMPEGYLSYFTRRYPRLFLHVHGVVKDTGLHSEPMFRAYFELPES